MIFVFVIVEWAIESNTNENSSYFSLHSFSSSWKFWNMLIIMIYLLADWVSRNFKKRRKKGTIFLPLQSFRSKTRDGSRQSERSFAGQLAVLSSLLSLGCFLCHLHLVFVGGFHRLRLSQRYHGILTSNRANRAKTNFTEFSENQSFFIREREREGETDMSAFAGPPQKKVATCKRRHG